MNAKLTLQVGQYNDKSWHVTIVETGYDDRGRAGSPQIVARRLCGAWDVRSIIDAAVDDLMRHAAENERQEQVAGGERENAAGHE